MFHKFREPGDWFAPKRYGYGSGLPIAWQGWVLSLAFCLTIIGIVYALPHLHGGQVPLAIAGMLVVTILFLVIVARRTRGGWRWRDGEPD